MRIIRTANYDDMSRKAANVIAAQVVLKPQSVLGLATGSTPIGTYERLVEMNAQGDIDFSQVITYNLDEYRGLSNNDVQSYHYFMKEHLFKHININIANTHVPDGSNPDADSACKAYDQAVVQAGGCDLQLLGIGNNGHIGFNEPTDHFIASTHCVNLSESTIEANSRLFNSKNEVPHQAYTMGIKTIMSAQRILIIANGIKKAPALKAMIEGPITPECPASILQLHPDCILIADEEALSACSM